MILALDDFREDNGATLVYPKSHLWGDVPSADIDVSKMVPAGKSALFHFARISREISALPVAVMVSTAASVAEVISPPVTDVE